MISYKIKFKIALLFSIFFFKEASAILISKYLFYSMENQTWIHIFGDIHETTRFIGENVSQEDIRRQLQTINTIANTNTKIFFENDHPISKISSLASHDTKITTLLNQVPQIIDSKNIIYSEKRISRSIQNILLILVDSIKLNHDLEIPEKDSLRNLTKKLKINNLKELKNTILNLIQEVDQDTISFLNALEYSERRELKTILNLNFVDLLNKIYSMQKSIKTDELKDDLMHFLMLLHSINTHQTHFVNNSNQLDELDMFLIESIEKNHSNSIVIVGAGHALKIADALQQNLKYRLVQNTWPEFNPAYSTPLEALAKRLTPEQIISR